MSLRLGILGSTRGSNLPPLHTAAQQGKLAAQFAVVISNKEQAGILDKARQFHIPALAIMSQNGETRAAYDRRVINALEQYKVNLVVLIGYMRILSPEFVAHYQDRIINVHPSLLPKHAGLMDLAVHNAVLAANEAETGCSVHLVDEEIDSGKILVQKRCAVQPEDNAETLKQKVQTLEAEALIEAINHFNLRT